MSLDIDRRGTKVDFSVALLHDWVEDFSVKEPDGSDKVMSGTTPTFLIFNQNGSLKVDLSSKLIKTTGHLGWLVTQEDLTSIGKGSWRYVISVEESGVNEPWLSGVVNVDRQYSERLALTSRDKEIRVKLTSGIVVSAGVSTSFGGDMTAHLLDPTPHPVYDDSPSLTLLFENGLV